MRILKQVKKIFCILDIQKLKSEQARTKLLTRANKDYKQRLKRCEKTRARFYKVTQIYYRRLNLLKKDLRGLYKENERLKREIKKLS